ncbi:thiopeptide-type bacteriocin biosynthesis protein [Tenacibaculum ovolyticum]|uniref:thiopeptide-type bacteriocin biosynthesis protein n=1 Tax=Tenacibaculum ovolyticum TaxID=104270 RepID=UPI0022F39CD0|nr:thiopeptide-type bacteriocin biosynthesis protein [Tenacibaculum ovolyticum]WBX76770.1 thiopeptide-type bacteriocin biosynthesis protein [Tenacibaculum ovolyticum]
MKQNFILGEEWLYYKIYCGKRTADKVLIDIIKPLSEELLEKKLIDQWFFIRYTDPKPHIRVRFHCKDINNIGAIINSVKNSTVELVSNGTIWSIQTDMYSRELERYGFNLINETEGFFYIDSQVSLIALNLIDDDTLLFLFSLRSIDTLLNAFNFDIEDKIRFTKYYFNVFKKEFNASKILNRQLNVKYQEIRQSITSFFVQPKKEYSPLIELLSDKEQQLRLISTNVKEGVKHEQISLEDFLASHIHMTVNRIFRDKQRLHELVCYSCLYRFYQFQKNADV